MGYDTSFSGSFELSRPLASEHRIYLEQFSSTRRVRRDAAKTARRPDPVREAAGLPVGPEGAYFVGADGSSGHEHSDDVLDFNRPPQGQPNVWCRWVPNEEGTALVWDGGPVFYDYVEWLEYLVAHFLAPWGHQITGKVAWSGEEQGDSGVIWARDNKVKAVPDEVLRKEPDWDDD